ncbi:S1C family serine protease [Salisediminibacterium halotolerans]|uniref:Trypsin-like peptidase domain-containing protein n=1 Tax=Salisediminibacterium halotolerans TaxID=517425 RepID=A0A1H9WPE1_9BACI|nr:S1C family serine protease [Salisediminibacterium haloalkalitolerans]SES35557.1 Trypsin-like peptidase domain-containing protein [Salisediminibacterium haloalkalitolerans]
MLKTNSCTVFTVLFTGFTAGAVLISGCAAKTIQESSSFTDVERETPVLSERSNLEFSAEEYAWVDKRENPLDYLGWEESLDYMNDAVVDVETPSQYGQGFYIEEDKLLTNAHVILNDLDADIVNQHDETVTAEVIGVSIDEDIALLEVDDTEHVESCIPLRADSELAEDDEIIRLDTNADFDENHYYGTLLEKSRSIYASLDLQENLYYLDLAIHGGDSGSPIVTEDAKGAVGVITARSDTVDGASYAIPVNNFHDYIDKWFETPMSEEQILDEFSNI